MSLSDEYRTAQATADTKVPLHDGQVRKIHAVMPHADATICGKVEALAVTYVKPAAPGHRYAVTCDDCLKALKRERQSRSRAGTAKAQERRAQQAESETHSIESFDLLSDHERKVMGDALRCYVSEYCGIDDEPVDTARDLLKRLGEPE